MIGDFTAIIVTCRSEEIIHQTIQNLPEDLNIIIVENSKNNEFKKLIENNTISTLYIKSHILNLSSNLYYSILIA